MVKVISCKCGSCPVLIETKEGAFRAGCSNDECEFFGLYTLTDYEQEYVLEQWNAVTESRIEDDE